MAEPEPKAAPAPKAAAPPKEELKEEPPAEEQPQEPSPLDSSVVMRFQSELDAESVKLGDAVQEAGVNRRQLEKAIALGDKRLADAKRDFTAKLNAQEKTTEQVKAHQTALDDLMKTLEREATAARSKVKEQQTAGKRLKEEYTTAGAATVVARATCADSRRLLAESIAAGKADIAKADGEVCRLEADAARATEALLSNRAAAAARTERITMLVTKATTAQREMDFHMEAAAKLSKEHEAANETIQNVRDADVAAKAALAAHRRDAGRRLRAREAEVVRTRGRLATAIKLRDLKLRGAMTGEDRDYFAPRGDAAHAAAQAAADAFARAEQGRDATRTADDEKLAELVAAQNKAAMNLNQRLRVTESLAERLLVRDGTAREAKKAWTVADAAVSSAKESLALLEERTDGPLTEASRDAEKAAEDARAIAVLMRREAADEEPPLRHNLEAEEVVLLKTEEAEVKLRDALAVAQFAAAEAEADAEAALDEQKATAAAAAEVAATPSLPQSDRLVLSDARRRLEEREADATQSRTVKEDAERALEDARAEFAEEKAKPQPQQNEEEDADLGKSRGSMNTSEAGRRRVSSAASRASFAGRIAALEAAIDEREVDMHLAVADLVTTEAAVVAAKNELAALEATAASAEEATQAAQQKLEAASSGDPDARLPATTPWATASLIRTEKNTVDTRLARHTEVTGELTAGMEKAEANWTAEKETLKADLHLAEMHLKQVSEDAEHHKELQEQSK